MPETTPPPAPAKKPRAPYRKRFQYRQDPVTKQWHCHLKVGKEIIAPSETYSRKAQCFRWLEIIFGTTPETTIIEQTFEK